MFQPGNQLAVGHGRPKGSGMPAFVREWAKEKGLQKLIDLAEGKGHSWRDYKGRLVEVGPSFSVQVEALKLALAYGLGKPRDVDDGPQNPEESKLRVDQMLELVRQASSRPPLTKPAVHGSNGANGHS